MITLLWIIAATLAVSALSFSGAIALFLKEEILRNSNLPESIPELIDKDKKYISFILDVISPEISIPILTKKLDPLDLFELVKGKKLDLSVFLPLILKHKNTAIFYKTVFDIFKESCIIPLLKFTKENAIIPLLKESDKLDFAVKHIFHYPHISLDIKLNKIFEFANQQEK